MPWDRMPRFDGDLVGALAIHTILMLPSFLWTNKARTAQGLSDSLTNPLLISSYSFLCIAIVSFRFILYAGIFRSMAPGLQPIWSWMDLLRGRLEGMSSVRICLSYLTNNKARG